MFVQVPHAVAAILSVRDTDTGRMLFNTWYLRSGTSPADPDEMNGVVNDLAFNLAVNYMPTWQRSLGVFRLQLVDLSPGGNWNTVETYNTNLNPRPGNPLPKAVAMIWQRNSAFHIGRSYRNRIYLFPTFDWAYRPSYPYYADAYYNYIFGWHQSDYYTLLGYGWNQGVYSRQLGQINVCNVFGLSATGGVRLGRRKEHGRR